MQHRETLQHKRTVFRRSCETYPNTIYSRHLCSLRLELNRTPSFFTCFTMFRNVSHHAPKTSIAKRLEAQYPRPPVYHPCAFAPRRSTARGPHHRCGRCAPQHRARALASQLRLVYHVRNPGRCHLEGSCGCLKISNFQIGSIMLHCVTCKAEKTSYFIPENGVGSLALVDKPVVRIIMLNA